MQKDDELSDVKHKKKRYLTMSFPQPYLDFFWIAYLCSEFKSWWPILFILVYLRIEERGAEEVECLPTL